MRVKIHVLEDGSPWVQTPTGEHATEAAVYLWLAGLCDKSRGIVQRALERPSFTIETVEAIDPFVEMAVAE